MYELVRKLQLEYAVFKSHYITIPTEGAYTTLKDKNTKVVNVLCLCFMYKTDLLKVESHPISRMDKLFQFPERLGANKCLYDEAKYANYPTVELRMEFYLQMMRTLTRRGPHLQHLRGFETRLCCHGK